MVPKVQCLPVKEKEGLISEVQIELQKQSQKWLCFFVFIEHFK
jgi:hypothetical protein